MAGLAATWQQETGQVGPGRNGTLQLSRATELGWQLHGNKKLQNGPQTVSSEGKTLGISAISGKGVGEEKFSKMLHLALSSGPLALGNRHDGWTGSSFATGIWLVVDHIGETFWKANSSTSATTQLTLNVF